MGTWSVERNDLLTFKEFRQSTRIEVCSSDLEAANTCCIDRGLAFLLELEGHLVPNVLLDWLRRHCGTLLLNRWELDRLWVSEDAIHEVAAKEDKSLARTLELFSELRQVSDVEGWTILLRLAEEQIVLAIS